MPTQQGKKYFFSIINSLVRLIKSKMKRTLIFFIFFLQLSPLIAQKYLSPIDSTIMSFRLNDEDWVISLTIDQAGTIPTYDSLGNILDDDPNGLYIISQINKQCEIRKFESYYTDSFPRQRIKLNRLINILDPSFCNYTKDSVQKAEKEWIYSNVYFDNRLKVFKLQQNSDHSPFFRLCFRTKQATSYSSFGEIDVANPKRNLGFFHENLNSKYNSSTFIYRAFINYINLLKKHFKVVILM